jgi:hypothetical protein
MVYGDTKNYDKEHAKFIQITNRMGDIEFAICVGDLTPMSNSTIAGPNSYNGFLNVANTLQCDFWPVYGNHDGKPCETTWTHYRNAFSSIKNRPEFNSGPGEYYSFDYHNCHFVVLDNVRRNDAEILEEQRWIAQDVMTDNAKNAGHIFTFSHYTCVSPGPSETYGYYRKFIQPYFEPMSNKTAHFQGDRHNFWKGTYRDMTFVTSPSICPARAAASPGPGEIADSFRGYVLVEVNGDLVTGKAYDLDENLKHSFIIKQGVTADVAVSNNFNKPINLTAYPNPAYTKMTITVSQGLNILDKDLKIFNAQGKLVQTFDCSKAYKQNGNLSFMWHAKNHPAGIYFAKFKTESRVYIKKLLLMQ